MNSNLSVLTIVKGYGNNYEIVHVHINSISNLETRFKKKHYVCLLDSMTYY